ncbi:MAG: spheroidene monooxygenase [Methylibium sp. NZG]|nr:MAG: spheroidene monooxygenase [Methylibium sp. NZG]
MPRATSSVGATAVLVLVDIAPRARWWGWSRYVIGRFSLYGVPGLRFFKIMGSGYEAGFGLRPSASRQGLFCLFDDRAAAQSFVDTSPVVAAYRSHAREFLSVTLQAFSSRGTWAGRALPTSLPAPQGGPIAALTRASIRPAVAWSFWRRAPATEASLLQAPGCLLAAGLGEAPLLRQATFSVWDSVQSMDAYARSGAHLQAIQAAHAQRYFSESMFVRFVPLRLQGRWKGRSFDETGPATVHDASVQLP